MKIVVDDKIPYIKGVLEKYAELHYLNGAKINNAVLQDADALITRTRTKCNAENLSGTKLKLITSATIGFDHIDTEWCDSNGIEWTNAPGCNSGSVMQYVAAVLTLLVRNKGWTLKGKSIAVVGVGNVGSKVSALANLLGMQVYEVDPPRDRNEPDKTFYNLHDVIDKVDVVTFHTPLIKDGIDKTYHLCNADLLLKMKPNAVVINSSRGEVIDGMALKKALSNNIIGDAVLDVWEQEPNIDTELLEKVWIATPHIAGYSQDGKAKGTEMSVQKISRYFNLGMDNWEVSGLPEPEQSEIVIDCQNLSEEEVIVNAILHTYPLMRDDEHLKEAPEKFEFLRGSYPIRREFKAFNVRLINGNAVLQNTLSALGFTS